MLIFLDREEELDYRTATQALPSGARPVAFVCRDEDYNITIHLYEWYMFRRADEAKEEIATYLKNDADFQMFKHDCPDTGRSFVLD